jgi:hypothetical protein
MSDAEETNVRLPKATYAQSIKRIAENVIFIKCFFKYLGKQITFPDIYFQLLN